jgi:hypothetical protein
VESEKRAATIDPKLAGGIPLTPWDRGSSIDIEGIRRGCYIDTEKG